MSDRKKDVSIVQLFPHLKKPPVIEHVDAIDDLRRQQVFLAGLVESLLPQYVAAERAGQLTKDEVAQAIQMLAGIQATLSVYTDYRVELRERAKVVSAELAKARAELAAATSSGEPHEET